MEQPVHTDHVDHIIILHARARPFYRRHYTPVDAYK